MNELFDAVASWPTLLSTLLIFGFAPGFTLRLLVLIYPKDDPRRKELMAELYVKGRVERLFFVCEQFETALLEGLPRRLKTIADKIRLRAKRKEKVAQDDVTQDHTASNAQKPGTINVRRSTTNLRRGARITGYSRDRLATEIKQMYEKGASIRALAESTGRSYGFVHRVLSESGVTLRGRGGATRSHKNR